MAKFTSFDAPQGVAGPTNSGMETAAHQGGGGQALASLGSDIVKFGGVLRQREDKRAITSARASFSEFQLGFEQDEITRRMAAPIGAPGHYEQSQQAFDAGISKLTEGMNDVQKNALAGLIGTARTSNLTSAMKFQAQSMVKGDLNNVNVIGKGIGAQLHNGTINLQQGMNLLKEALIDTTIGAAGQQELVTRMLPEFRKQAMDGLVSNPIEGLRRLEAGELKGFPPDELFKLKGDLVTAINGLNKKQKMEEFAAASQTHSKAFELATGQGTPQEVEAASAGLSPEIRNMFKKMAIDRDRPVRTIEEKSNASSDLFPRYEELSVKLKNKKRTSTSSMEELLTFQTETTQLVLDGFVTKGDGHRYIKNVEEVMQRKIEDAGTSWVEIFDQTPFNVGMDRVNKHVETNKLSKSAHVNIARRFNEYLDRGQIASGSDQTEGRDEQVNMFADLAIRDYVNKQIPATRGLKTLPNSIISNGKITPGLPGKRDLAPTKQIAGGTQTEHDPQSDTYAVVTRDKDGKVTDFKQVTKEQAFTPPPTPVEEGADQDPTDGRVLIDLPQRAFDQTGGEQGSSDDVPTEAPNLTMDDTAAATDATDEFQKKLAADAETEILQGEPEFEDTDPAPGSVAVKIPLAPAEQAIDMVQSQLIANEGTGDTLTGIPTGEGGITEVRKKEIERKKGRALTDEQARNEAVREDSAALTDGMPGFSTLRANVQAALVDMSYTVGVNNVLSFPNLRKAVSSGNVGAILRETLDTAVVDGKSVKGLALRRARMFNQASRDFRITEVEQLRDGTINYLSGTEVLFTFKQPKHSQSKAGKETVAHG